MGVKNIFVFTVATFIVVGFLGIGVNDLVDRKDKVDFQGVQLKSRSSEIKQLNVKYDELNTELDKVSEQEKAEKAEVERLEKERQELELLREKLERELQSKREEESRLAQASSRVANAVTGTQTVSAAATTESSGSYSRADLEKIVRDAANKYGISVDRAFRIANCESTWNPRAVNQNYYENGHPSGLFQHISGYWAQRAVDYGYPGASVFDPVANANVTMGMWRDGHANLWECV